MDSLTLTLPFPPSVNHYWRHALIGRRGVAVLVSAEGRRYQYFAGVKIFEQGVPETIDHGVAMEVLLYPPDRRKRDVDNYSKALLDVLVRAGVLLDDSLVKDLRLVLMDPIKGGKAQVTIRGME